VEKIIKNNMFYKIILKYVFAFSRIILFIYIPKAKPIQIKNINIKELDIK